MWCRDWREKLMEKARARHHSLTHSLTHSFTHSLCDKNSVIILRHTTANPRGCCRSTGNSTAAIRDMCYRSCHYVPYSQRSVCIVPRTNKLFR
jgi:hypothetical protein